MTRWIVRKRVGGAGYHLLRVARDGTPATVGLAGGGLQGALIAAAHALKPWDVVVVVPEHRTYVVLPADGVQA